ncbi:MAG TPA: dockerin type I repeat-containing protein [Armatimonadota bacterium]|jgi:hypothetical protein
MKHFIAVAWGLFLTGGMTLAATVYGDVTGDGQVTPADVTLLARVAGGLAPITDGIRRNGDVAPLNDYEAGSFGDGQITVLDAIRVARYLHALEPPEWPARPTYFPLEIGNSSTFRAYSSAGTPITGPGTGNPDITFTASSHSPEVVAGITYDAFTLFSPIEQLRVAPTMDPQNSRRAVARLGASYSDGSTESYSPPELVLEYPVQNGIQWGPDAMRATFDGVGIDLTYTGRTEGPMSVNLPTGLAFDNAYKITVSGVGTGYSYTAVYWHVAFVGLVMTGFSETQGGTTTSFMPELALVSANNHCVLYP